jgi:hypothetical protein
MPQLAVNRKIFAASLYARVPGEVRPVYWYENQQPFARLLRLVAIVEAL